MTTRCRVCSNEYEGGATAHALTDAHAAVAFWPYVDKGDGSGHWMWTGPVIGRYGRVPGSLRVNGKYRAIRAHRYSWRLLQGPIPPDFEVDHVCRTPLCVRPTLDAVGLPHLEAVTQRVNTLRSNGASARNARKTHCPQGHQLPPYKDGYWRQCTICRRALTKERTRRWRERLISQARESAGQPGDAGGADPAGGHDDASG